jgi:hypothetical protein
MSGIFSRSCAVSPQAVPPASRRGSLLLFFLILFPLLASAQTPTERVGIPITLTDIYIPGGEARPKPRVTREPPLVLRLLRTRAAADGLRYDLEIYGLEPGTYNVADFLEPVNPANPPKFPEIPLTITTELPPGLVKPTELTSNPPKRVGGYFIITILLACFWVFGLILLIVLRRHKASISGLGAAAPPTLAERLHKLVTAAANGELNTDEQAALERLILGHWIQRLPELAPLPPGEALTQLRQHKEAGPLLQQLERWLHAKNSTIEPNEIEALLTPYRN